MPGPPPVRARAALALVVFAAMMCTPAALAEQYRLPLFVSETAQGQQGVLRVLSLSDVSGTVEVYAVDDSGVRSGPATFTLDPRAAKEFDAADLASGNAGKGLTGGLGTLSGDVRLEIDTALRVDLLAYLRSADGTLAVLHDEVRARIPADGGYEYLVPIFNPAQDMAQSSRLRLINPGDTSASVTIEGRDDAGAMATGESVQLTLPAAGARTLTAQQLEAGDAGLTGMLGAGSGRWRLLVSSDQSIRVVSLVTSSTGQLANLSTTGLKGAAPADLAAFGARFAGVSINAESGDLRTTLATTADNGFTEVVDSMGVTDTRAGSRAYERTGGDAGRLTLSYDDGDRCAWNLYFTSRTGGWFASRCTGADEPDGYWRGGSWSAADEDAPAADTSPAFPATGRPGDQAYTVGMAIAALTLPSATGGDGTLAYNLSPEVPGLSFDAMTRQLTGTPTAAGTYATTYTVTDADGDSDTFRFGIAVSSDTTGQTDLGDCEAGLVVRPGQHCAYPGTEEAFSVLDDGRATFLVITSARAININSVTFRGRFYDFRASHQGDGVWWLDRVEGVTVPPPPPDLKPSFAAAGPGDQNYTLDTAIAPLILPAASGGDGELGYTLSPEVPGLIFHGATRLLSGTPIVAGTYAMTYTVTDVDGDSDSLAFGIEVRAPDLFPEFGPDVGPRDQSYTRGVAISPLLLPAATGGDGELSYSLTPSIPGLSFDPATRQLTGTPTSSGTRAMTYEVTDADGDTDTLSFTIRVRAPAAPDSSPEFDADAGPGDQGYTQGTAITPLTLPEATGGDGILSYSLTPEVPGLSFSPATRRLTGTPTAVGSHAMTYSATDADGDSDSLAFRIEVRVPDSSPDFGPDVGQGDQSYTQDTAITPLLLPAASGGNGELDYSLSPAVPGLTFDPATRRLTGTPTAAGTHAMTYEVTDADGDSDTLSFGIVVRTSEAALGDREVLVALYNATDGANWTDNTNWLSTAPLGEWHGVTVDESGRVTELHLSAKQLSGTIPAELGQLSSLERLFFNTNQLSGTIPAELGQLSSLEFLSFDRNQLSGAIPVELGGLSSLEHLVLSTNELTGAIPRELGNLSSLDSLWLEHNQLSGSIPAELGELSSLKYAFLGKNQFSGAIPKEMGNLSNMEILTLDETQVSGSIPAELGGLSKLTTLILQSNMLSGAIPAELGNLSNLLLLGLGRNQLSGAIPSELGNLSNLVSITLAPNNFTGCIPSELRDIPSNDFSNLGLPYCDDT